MVRWFVKILDFVAMRISPMLEAAFDRVECRAAMRRAQHDYKKVRKHTGGRP